jgi:hypothetical protein
VAGELVGGDEVDGGDVDGGDVEGGDVEGGDEGGGDDVVLGATEPDVWSAAGEDSPQATRIKRAAVPEMSTR